MPFFLDSHKKNLLHFLQVSLWPGIFFVIVFWGVSGTAVACSVCFSGKEETLQAFYVTTIFLTLLPLLMLASIGFWLYHRHQKT